MARIARVVVPNYPHHVTQRNSGDSILNSLVIFDVSVSSTIVKIIAVHQSTPTGNSLLFYDRCQVLAPGIA